MVRQRAVQSEPPSTEVHSRGDGNDRRASAVRQPARLRGRTRCRLQLAPPRPQRRVRRPASPPLLSEHLPIFAVPPVPMKFFLRVQSIGLPSPFVFHDDQLGVLVAQGHLAVPIRELYNDPALRVDRGRGPAENAGSNEVRVRRPGCFPNLPVVRGARVNGVNGQGLRGAKIIDRKKDLPSFLEA